MRRPHTLFGKDMRRHYVQARDSDPQRSVYKSQLPPAEPVAQQVFRDSLTQPEAPVTVDRSSPYPAEAKPPRMPGLPLRVAVGVGLAGAICVLCWVGLRLLEAA